MNQIERISIEGFRRLTSIDVEMRPLTVLIGSNGVGKTSFMDALTLVSQSALGKLQHQLSELGGLSDLLTRQVEEEPFGAETLKFDLTCSVTVPKKPVRRVQQNFKYSLSIRGTSHSYLITTEKLLNESTTPVSSLIVGGKIQPVQYYDDSSDVVEPTWDYNPSETALSQVPKTFVMQERVRSFVAQSSRFGPIDVAPRASIRFPQSLRPVTMPGDDGEDIVSYLYTLRENHPQQFRTIEDTIAAAFPDFERLGFPPVAAGVLAMTWKDKNYTTPLYMNQLSEGTLRFLWLVSLLQSPDLPAITLIDEPEVSMHPELLSLLAQLLREASERSQIIVATHSDRLVRFLKPSEVLVMDSEDGYAKMTWADTMDIDHWLKDYSLDEIWQMGQIGGRA